MQRSANGSRVPLWRSPKTLRRTWDSQSGSVTAEVNGLCAHSLPSRETGQIGNEIRVVFTTSPLCPHRRFIPEVIHLAVSPSHRCRNLRPYYPPLVQNSDFGDAAQKVPLGGVRDTHGLMGTLSGKMPPIPFAPCQLRPSPMAHLAIKNLRNVDPTRNQTLRFASQYGSTDSQQHFKRRFRQLRTVAALIRHITRICGRATDSVTHLTRTIVPFQSITS